jgi:hypothetical protein
MWIVERGPSAAEAALLCPVDVRAEARTYPQAQGWLDSLCPLARYNKLPQIHSGIHPQGWAVGFQT